MSLEAVLLQVSCSPARSEHVFFFCARQPLRDRCACLLLALEYATQRVSEIPGVPRKMCPRIFDAGHSQQRNTAAPKFLLRCASRALHTFPWNTLKLPLEAVLLQISCSPARPELFFLFLRKAAAAGLVCGFVVGTTIRDAARLRNSWSPAQDVTENI
jgi:hypothetical protein